MFDPNKAVEREGMPIRGRGDSQFDMHVRAWRLCLHWGYGYSAAYHYRKLLRLRGYRGMTLVAPMVYFVRHNRLTWFRASI